MPCMCGDPYCGSCGPAQGYNPELEAFYETLFAKFPWVEDLPPSADFEELVDYLLEEGAKLERDNVAQAEAEAEMVKEEEEAQKLADEHWNSQ